jgi:pimeloyl-ACP methyl ester carboxylesterase
VTPPLLLIWGERDPFGVKDLAGRSLALCADGRSRFFFDATHWVEHDEPQACLSAMLDFLRPRVQPPA